MARTQTARQCQSLVALLATMLFLSSCSLSNDNPELDESGDEASSSDVVPAEVKPAENSPESAAMLLSDQDSSAPGQSVTETDQAASDQPDSTQASVPIDDSALVQLLLTDYTIDAEQVVPTSTWICTDVFDQNRALYFFSEGVLDASRQVAVERTLNVNNTFDDIAFFWSVSARDSIIMASTTTSDSTGALLSTGQQYDVSGIRFFEVESRRSFTANSVLRGQLTCALYDI